MVGCSPSVISVNNFLTASKSNIVRLHLKPLKKYVWIPVIQGINGAVPGMKIHVK